MSIRKFRLKSWLQPQLPLGRVPAWVALVLRGAHVCHFLCSTRKREVVLFRLSEGEIDVRRLRANQSGVTENVNFSNGREAWHLSVFQASQHIYNVARAVPHCRYVVLFDWVNSWQCMTPFDYTDGFNLTSKVPRTVRFGVARVIQDMIKKIYPQSRLLF